MSSSRDTTHLEVLPPAANAITVQATSAVAAVLDLTLATSTSGFTAESLQFSTQEPVGGARSEATSSSGGGTVQAPSPLNPAGYIGRWIDVFADGQDLGVIFGATNAAVSGGNAPMLATNGLAGTAGVCYRIPSGTYRPFFVPNGDYRFLGFVAAGNGQMRIFPSSRPVS